MSSLDSGSDDPVGCYCALLSDLSRDRLQSLAALCAEDIVFKDPFNETVGIDAYLRVLTKMFDDVESHSFTVTGRAGTGRSHYLHWLFRARLRSNGMPLDIEGMSEVTVDENGRISRHVDYWDVGRDFYERLPVVGRLIAWIRRRAAA